MSPAKIVIIGGGPSGLTLARLLQKNQIPCVVYEGEPDRRSRNQGGSLDLHPKAGQLALAEAGLTREFRAIARPEGEMMKILSPSGEILWDENLTGNWRPHDLTDRPEVDRTALRDMLIDSLEPDTIKWGRRISRVEPEGEEGKHTIIFEDGSQETGINFLIGADGAFSKVRPLVTSEKPHYSGITCVELWKMDAENTHPWLAEQVGSGSCFMFDEGRALLAQKQGNGAVRAYCCVRKPMEWAKECGIDWDDTAEAREALVEGYFGDCGENVKRMIREGSDYLVIRHLWMLPVGHTWESKLGVTVMGDAAHLMTPFAGVGVNTAMADSLDLAREIIKRKEVFTRDGGEDRVREVGRAVHEYERNMFVRAEIMTSKTYEGLKHHFRATGGEEWAERYRKHYEAVKAQGLVKE